MKFLKTPALALATVFALAAVFAASNSVAADKQLSQCLLKSEDLQNDAFGNDTIELFISGLINIHLQNAQDGREGSLETAEALASELSGDAKEMVLIALMSHYLQNGDDSSLDKAAGLVKELSGDNKEMMLMALMSQYLQNGDDSSLDKAEALVEELSGDNKEMMLMAIQGMR